MANIISRHSVKPWVGKMAVAFTNTFVAKLGKGDLNWGKLLTHCWYGKGLMTIYYFCWTQMKNV